MTRNTEGGLLPESTRKVAKKEYDSAIAEINRQKDDWRKNKSLIQGYWDQYERGGELSDEIRGKLAKENDYVRDQVAVLTSGQKTWKQLNDEKEEQFKEPEVPKTFKASLKGLASSALSSLGNLAMGAFVGLALEGGLTLIGKAYDAIAHREENIIAKGDEARDSIKQQTEAYQTQKSTLGELTSQYEKLSKGVKISGNQIKNISLSEAEYEQFLQTTNAIADTAPSLVKSWDSQGNAILSAGTNVSDLNKQVEDYLRIQRNLIFYNTKDKIQEQYEGVTTELKQARQEMDEYNNDIDYNQKKAEKLTTLYDALTDDTQKGPGYFSLMADDFYELSNKILDIKGMTITPIDNFDGTYSFSLDTSDFNTDELDSILTTIGKLKTSSQTAEAEAKDKLQSLYALTKQNAEEILPSIQSLIDANGLFDTWDDQELATTFKDKLSSMVSNIDIMDLSEMLQESGKNVYEWTMEDIIQPMSEAAEKGQEEVWEKLFKLEPQKGESVSEFAQRRDDLLNQIAAFSDTDIWTKGTLAKALGYAYTDPEGKTIWNTQEKLDQAQQAVLNATENAKVAEKIRGYLRDSIDINDFETAMNVITSGDTEALSSLDSFIAAFEELKSKAEEIAEIEKYSLSNMQENVTKAQTALSSFSTVLTETTSAGGLSADNIKILNSTFEDLENVNLSALYKNTADGVKLNIDTLKTLTKQQNDLKSSEFAKSIEVQNKQLKEQADIITDVTKSEEERQAAKDSYDSLLKDLNAIQQAQSQWYALRKQQEELFSDYSSWQRATQTSNAGDKYTNLLSGLKATKEAYDKGLVGTDDFKTFARLISPAGTTDPENFAENYTKASRYLTEDASGVKAFLDDLDAKGLAEYNDETERWTYNIKDMANAAQSLGIGEEFLSAMFQRLEDYGFHNNFVSSIEEGKSHLSDITDKLTTAQKELAELEAQGASSSAIEAKRKEVDGYLQDMEDTQENINAFEGMSSKNLVQQKQDAKEAIESLSKLRDEAKTNNTYGDNTNAYVDSVNEQIASIANESGITLTPQFNIDKKAFQDQLNNLEVGSWENPLNIQFEKGSDEAYNYAGALEKVKTAHDENSESMQSSLDILSKYTAEELRSIQLGNGEYDVEGLENAEDALESIAKEAGLSAEQAKQLVNVLAAVGVLDPDTSGLDELSNSAETAKESLQNLDGSSLTIEVDGQEGLESLSETLASTPQGVSTVINASVSGADDLNTFTSSLENIPDETPTVVNCEVTNQEELDTVTSKVSELNTNGKQITLNATLKPTSIEAANEAEVTVKDATVKVVPEPNPIEVDTVPAAVDITPNPSVLSVPDAEANANYSLGEHPAEVPDADGKANFDLGEHPVSAPDIWGTAKYNGDFSLVGEAPVLHGTIVYTQTVTGGISGGGFGGGGGGSWATGSLTSARASGTAYNVLNLKPAYVNGKVALDKNEKALVNELGTESLIRDGIWSLLPGGMHIETLKKGDIILNAQQTADLLNHGRTRGHARAYAAGTLLNAYASGTDLNKGWGQFSGGAAGKTLNKSSNKISTNEATKTAKSAQDTAKAAEDIQASMDWIEIAISRIQRKVQNLKSVAENVYKSFTVRNKNLTSEIKSIRKEIDIQTKGAKRYKKEADSVGLSAKLKKRVQNGTIDINKYDEDTQNKIKEYQQWYEKMLSCKDAVSELKDTITELYRQKFDNIITKWSNSVQDLEHQAERTESAISNRTNKASEYVTIDNSTSASRMNISDYRSLISNQQSQIAKKQAELAELQSNLDWAVKNSKTTGITKGSEGYYDMLAEIQSVEKEIDSLNGEIIDGVNSVAEEYMNIFDNIATDFENKLSLSEHISNVYSNALDLAEEKGFMASTKYYEMLSGIEKDNIGVMEQELESLKQAANEAIASGAVEVGSQSWYDMQQQINEVAESTDEARLKLEQYANAIRQIGWDRFDYLQDKISLITDEANFLIDLMSNSDLFTDKGIVNDEGMATFGLHGQNYNVLMRQADDYAAQIKKIESDIANDPSDTKLIERKEELIRLQQESIKAAEDEKQAIKSLVKEGIDKQLESLKDLIDEYKDALKSQKDLYDYQKNISDQVKNISSLQKQLNVYEGDTSEENQAKVQKLKVEYDEAQSKLEETQYDHFISDQEKLLDDLYDDYEKVLNERLDNIDALIKGVCDAVNANSGNINRTLGNLATNVGYTLSGELQSIWGKDGTIFSVLETYHNGFVGEGGMLNAVATTLDSIKISVEKMAVSADKNAGEADKKAEENNIQQQPVQTTPTVEPVVQSTPTGNPTPTAQPAVTDIQNPISQSNDKIMKIINSGKKHDKKISDYENKKHSDLWKYLVKSYGRDTSESIMKKLANALGVSVSKDITESEKKTVLKALKKKGYASGTRRVGKNEWNWTNEDWQDGKPEMIVRKSDGAILTPLNLNDMVYNAMASENVYDFAQDPKGYIRDLMPEVKFPTLPHTNVSHNTNVGDTTINLYLEFPNVQDYQQLKYAMQHDRDFEGFIQDITVNRLAGRSKNAKYNRTHR